MKVLELRHILDKVEASWRRAMVERHAELASEKFMEVPEITDEIGALAERIEDAFDDLFITRVAYVFDGSRDRVRVPIEDLLNLLLETDFA